MDANSDSEAFVEFVVKNLVDNPDAVVLEKQKTDRGILIRIRCDKPDIAKVIGRRGRNISSIRQLAAGAAARNGQRVDVDVLD